MAVERIDYSSDADYQQALAWEEADQQRYLEEQWAREAEAASPSGEGRRGMMKFDICEDCGGSGYIKRIIVSDMMINVFQKQGETIRDVLHNPLKCKKCNGHGFVTDNK